jgi:hypothetical protein
MTRLTSAFAALALLTACGGEQPAPTANTFDARPLATESRQEEHPGDLGAAVERDLAALRRLTAPFHRFAAARAAGWSTQITPCMTDPNGAGGMGFHYGNTAFIDGTAQVLRPQLLLYEPQKNGRLELVAVEYIIPYTFHARSAEPPVLFGQKFKQVDAFQLWGLHAWVWEKNRSGVFADWNPAVTCDHATSRMVMAH